MKKTFLPFLLTASLMAQGTALLDGPTVPSSSPVAVMIAPAQDADAISGTVIDQASREPVAAAKVSLLGTAYTAATATDGQYVFRDVPDGVYQMKAEAAGYESQVMNNVILNRRTGNLKIFFTLQPSAQVPPPEYVPVEKQPVPIAGRTPAPAYPELAQKAGIVGTVWVKLWIDVNGDVKKADILRSDAEIFNQSSIDAAMKWKFEPAIMKGKPVAVWVTVPFKYSLGEVTPSEKLDEQPGAETTVSPAYPESARRLGLEGMFYCDVVVNEKGWVESAVVKRLHVTDHKKIDTSLEPGTRGDLSKAAYAAVNDMSNEAIAAVRKWKFKPGMKDGKPVKAKVVIPVKYALSEKGSKK